MTPNKLLDMADIPKYSEAEVRELTAYLRARLAVSKAARERAEAALRMTKSVLGDLGGDIGEAFAAYEKE